MNLQECRENYLCMAYSNSDVREQGSGCVLWFHDLVDIRQVSNGGQDPYIQIEVSKQAGRHVVNTVLINVITVAVLFGLVLFCYYLSRRKTKVRGISGQVDWTSEGPKEDLELPYFEATMANATDNFSLNNKLGGGGLTCLQGNTSRWTGNCCEEAFQEFWTRIE